MRKKTMSLLGREAEVTEVDVVEKKGERAAEYTLEDGALIRVTTVPTSVVRIDGQYNSNGLPIYILTMSPATFVVSAPDELKRKD